MLLLSTFFEMHLPKSFGKSTSVKKVESITFFRTEPDVDSVEYQDEDKTTDETN